MKKLIIVLVAAFTFVACNNSAETTTTSVDSVDTKVDSVKCTDCVDSTAAGTATTPEIK